MPEFIVSYDLVEGVQRSQRIAFRDVICETVVWAERRLKTVWRVLGVEEDAVELERALVEGAKRHSELGRAFVKNNLRMVVVLADEDSSGAISEHNTSALETC